MAALLDALTDTLGDWIDGVEMAQEKVRGDAHARMIMSSTVPLLVEQMSDMDLSEQPTYKGHKLMPLGESWGGVAVGAVKCTRMIYLGDDGNIYIEGPQRRMNMMVIGVHPYGIKDATGWDGISLSEIAGLVATYTI